MPINSFPDSIRKTAITLFVLGITSFLYAAPQQPSLDLSRDYGYPDLLSPQEERDLSRLQKEARLYRAQGLELQHLGNIDDAFTLYQKAVELDPSYAIAFNDLGVIYEARGALEQAEECYLKAINIEPDYMSAYTNLALLYENKRDLGKAAVYWQKRAELGLPNDPWTQKAEKRLEDIKLTLSNDPSTGNAQEREVIELLRDVATQKSAARQDDKGLSRNHFDKAKRSYLKGDYATAIKEALDAQQLDPSNRQIEDFIDKTRTRALSK
ncbi:MAG: tetratricopeptide repeat protein [Candidatus Omnitrophota bacterium]